MNRDHSATPVGLGKAAGGVRRRRGVRNVSGRHSAMPIGLSRQV